MFRGKPPMEFQPLHSRYTIALWARTSFKPPRPWLTPKNSPSTISKRTPNSKCSPLCRTASADPYRIFAKVNYSANRCLIIWNSSTFNLVSIAGKTLDGPPSGPPTDIRVGVINNTAAFVRWSPPSPAMLNGELTGYKVSLFARRDSSVC